MSRWSPFPPRAAALAAGLAFALAACGDGESLQGTREPCSTASGTLLGCSDDPIQSAEDACWRLVECGVIPLDFDDEVNEYVLDWANCVRLIERMSEVRYEYTLQCVEASSCDDLKVAEFPVDPGSGDRALPLCLQYGDRN